ncbi:hydroxyacylglutathione hydrolase [Roseovarius sp. MBR-51]
MVLQILTVPCLADNYAYIAHDPATGVTAVIDVPEAEPILQALDKQGWSASLVLLTHHHADHIQGLGALLARHSASVIGAAADAHRLPPLDRTVSDGDQIGIGSETGVVMDVSGHTVGHLAFHFPQSAVVFTADSLMAMGCGRVFEGTMAQMFESLGKISSLPPQTTICSGHEYTESNAKFARTVDPDNAALISRSIEISAARAAGRPTVPSILADELATNPFLRAGDAGIQAQLGMTGSAPVDVFAEIRARKDRF